MIAFHVADMTCGHCAGTLTRALGAVDPGAVVKIDLARHLLTVDPADADADALRDAIVAAGYTPARVAGAAEGVVAAAPTAASCCGGGRCG